MRVIYGLIGAGILQSLILVQRQVLIICIVVMRRVRCQGLIVERPFLVSVGWKYH